MRSCLFLAGGVIMFPYLNPDASTVPFPDSGTACGETLSLAKTQIIFVARALFVAFALIHPATTQFLINDLLDVQVVEPQNAPKLPLPLSTVDQPRSCQR